MNREYHKWHSPHLGRDMELLAFSANAGHAGEPVLLFPTSRGRFYQNEDFGLVGAVADKIDAGRYLVLCVDSVDGESWYNDGAHPRDRIRRHGHYERYILEEAVPFLRRRASPGRLTFAGCSFGGFHAMNLGLKSPGVAQRLISMGGKFETEGYLSGYHDQSVYFHSATQWLPNLADEGILANLRGLEIILAAGEHDFCLPSTRRLSSILHAKGIGNHLAVWNGGQHDWPVWREMIAKYLPW